MGTDLGRRAMAAIGRLADELRQRLYRFVASQPGPVTRDQAAVGFSRKLAAFQLDKLVAAGRLEVATPRLASTVRHAAQQLARNRRINAVLQPDAVAPPATLLRALAGPDPLTHPAPLTAELGR